MHERYCTRAAYFAEQAAVSERFILPSVAGSLQGRGRLRVLEVGCGGGGSLKPFLDRGCEVLGLDLARYQVECARHFFAGHRHQANLTLLCGSVYDLDPTQTAPFDLIILRDKLEVVANQHVLLQRLRQLLAPSGTLFVSIASWWKPFEEHRQRCCSALRWVPVVHLLPGQLYRRLLGWAGESTACIEALMQARSQRLCFQRFLGWIRRMNYQVVRSDFYLHNPQRQVRFGLAANPLRWGGIPFLRDYICSTCYCVLAAR